MPANSHASPRLRTSLSSLLADAGLALVTLIWGLTFVVVKDAVAQVPVMTFLAWRFGVGAVALLPLSFRGLRTASRREWAAGALIGVSLFAGYVLQTAGLQWTTASKTGFITGLYVPLVPLFAWPLMREKPSRNAIAGLALATIGLALLSLRGDLRIEKGDLLVLGCAVAFAWQVVLIAYFAPRMPALTLAQAQITVVAVASALVAALAGERLMPLPRAVWGAVAFNGVLATSVALGLQNWLQGKTSATHAALIFVLEPVFAAMFGWILAGETLDLRGWIGSGMILAGMIVGQRNNRSGTAPGSQEGMRGTSGSL